MRQQINKQRFAVYCDAAGFTPGIIDVHSATKKKSIERSNDQILIAPQYNEKTKVKEKLDINTWLPYAAKKYELSADIRDYFFVPVITIPSDLPNRNGVAFPLKTLLEFSVEDGMQAYKSFKGKPVHFEHCFTGSTPVLSSTGWKKIRRIKVGDSVLSDSGTWKKVSKVFVNEEKRVSKIHTRGLPTIKATSNHPFLVAKKSEVLDGRKVRPRLTKDSYSYLPVSEMERGDYLVVPKTFNTGTSKIDADFAFLVGLFAAEGSFRKKDGQVGSALFTLSFYEEQLQEKVEGALTNLGLNYAVHLNPKGGTFGVHVKDADFAKKLKALVGEYSASKRLSSEIRSWDTSGLKNFLGGFISGDGSCKGRRMRIRTSSMYLAYDVYHMLISLGLPASLNIDGKKGKHGRLSDTYMIGLNLADAESLSDYIYVTKPVKVESTKPRRSIVIMTEDAALVPISRVDWNAATTTVYNLEVEDDHTYIAGGALVHNCNDKPEEAYGVIADSFLRKMDGFGKGKVWKLLELLAIDRTKYPSVAQSILSGDLNSYSMGAWVTSYSCSICGSPMGKCNHLHPKQPLDFYAIDNDLCFRNVHGIKGFETSIVATPAYSVAASNRLMV